MKKLKQFWVWEIFCLIGAIAVLFAAVKMPQGHFGSPFEWYDLLGMFGVIFILVGVFGVTKNLRSRGLMR